MNRWSSASPSTAPVHSHDATWATMSKPSPASGMSSSP